jgi:hypothetical protein
MNVSRLEKTYLGILIVIFAGIVIHTPISVVLGVVLPDYSLLIKSWKEILMLVAAVLAIVILTKRRLWRELLSDWIFRLVAIYAALHLVLAVLSSSGGVTAIAAGLAIDLRYVLFFGLTYIGVRIVPQYRRLMVQVAIAGACIIVGFATLQFFLPPDILSHIGYSRDTIMPYLTVDKNPEYVRVNSTLRGPNPVGAYAGMALGLLVAALVRMKLQLQNKKVLVATILFGVCSTAALWLSYSRSALVAGLITVLVVVAATVLRKLSRRAWIVSSVVVFALLGALVIGRDSAFVSNVLLHENTEGGSSVSSNDEHVASLQFGFDRLVHQPFGAGIGSTGSASLHGDVPVIIENQYLFVAHETGWLGLVLFIALFALIMARLWKNRQDWLSLGVFASGVGLSLIGLLLPVWADDTVSIVWWGLAAIALAGGVYGREK